MDCIKGVDLSHHNSDETLHKCLADKEIKYIWLKASEGATYRDKTFITRAARVGDYEKIIGAYHYARPENGNGAIDEANNFFKTIESLTVFHPLIALDWEGNALGWKDRNARERWIIDFVYRINKLVGYKPFIYLQSSAVHDYPNIPQLNVGLWVAKYGGRAARGQWPFISMRQTTDNPYDKDEFYGTIEQLNKYRGL